MDREGLSGKPIGEVRDVVLAVLRMVDSEFADDGEEELRGLLAEDFVEHVPLLAGRPWERIQLLRSAFPDMRMTVHDLIVDGDRAVWRWTFTGTHRGEFAGVAPTGRRVEYDGASIEHVRDGRIVERWDFPDLLTALAQMGALPAGP
jgi:predicted ester cyclase